MSECWQMGGKTSSLAGLGWAQSKEKERGKREQAGVGFQATRPKGNRVRFFFICFKSSSKRFF
jgi:hypothetical protein